MGRRKDDPLLQAAKGFPGRRKSAVKKAIEGGIKQQIEEIAASIEAVPETARDPFPLPDIFIRSPAYWRVATGIWRQMAEVLRASGRLRPAYRHGLARFCIWQFFYYDACESIRKKGMLITFRKGDGHDKTQENPAMHMMVAASRELRLLESEFGFTPLRDQDIARIETFNARQGQLPLTDSSPAENPMGMMNDDEKSPAGSRPH